MASPSNEHPLLGYEEMTIVKGAAKNLPLEVQLKYSNDLEFVVSDPKMLVNEVLSRRAALHLVASDKIGFVQLKILEVPPKKMNGTSSKKLLKILNINIVENDPSIYESFKPLPLPDLSENPDVLEIRKALERIQSEVDEACMNVGNSAGFNHVDEMCYFRKRLIE